MSEAAAPRLPGGTAAAWPLGSLAARSFEEPFAFDFFQAVRILERLTADTVPVGHNGPPHLEPVRFRAHQSLCFPPSSIHQLDRPDAWTPAPQMTVAFMGLTGPQGVLPRHYTEMIQRSERERRDSERRALRDWFDLINHRFVSLFFRAWEKYRFFVPYARRKSRRDDPDPFTNVLLSLAGAGQATLRDRLRVVAVWPRPNGPPRQQVLTRVETLALAYYSGLLAQRPRNALGLEAVLHDFFRLPIRVLQFQGEWLRLEPSKQSALGAPRLGKLSVTALVGDRVWDVQGKVRLRIGPLTYAQYLSLLPDRWPFPERKHFFELTHLARFYVGPGLAFEVQLILRREEIPECQLPEEAEEGPQLGRNAWLLSETPDRDAEDAVFEGEDVVHLSPVAASSAGE